MSFKEFGEYSSAALTDGIAHVTIDKSPLPTRQIISMQNDTTYRQTGFRHGADRGQWAVGNTATEFDAFIKAEQARWKPVFARAQIQSEGA